MAHDWGTKVPPDLSMEQMIDVRDRLVNGTLTIDFPPKVEAHPKAEEWRTEMRDQMIDAYNREIVRRAC